MNEATVKAIENIIVILQSEGYLASGAVLTWTGAQQLEKALRAFAEGVKLDAIEP